MSALTIIQKVCSRLSLTIPSAVFSSTDNQIVQMRTLLNQEGPELAKASGWTALTKETSFTTVAADVQTNAVPSDFQWYVNDTLWNRTLKRPYLGPVTAKEWQKQQAYPVTALPNGIFRFRGGDLVIYPNPTAGQSAYYEYVSTQWAETSGGSGLTAMTADNDTTVLDEEIHVLGVLWRFKMAHGLDYAEYFRTYELMKADAIAKDGGKPILTLGGPVRSIFSINVPENGYGV